MPIPDSVCAVGFSVQIILLVERLAYRIIVEQDLFQELKQPTASIGRHDGFTAASLPKTEQLSSRSTLTVILAEQLPQHLNHMIATAYKLKDRPNSFQIRRKIL